MAGGSVKGEDFERVLRWFNYLFFSFFQLESRRYDKTNEILFMTSTVTCIWIISDWIDFLLMNEVVNFAHAITKYSKSKKSSGSWQKRCLEVQMCIYNWQSKQLRWLDVAAGSCPPKAGNNRRITRLNNSFHDIETRKGRRGYRQEDQIPNGSTRLTTTMATGERTRVDWLYSLWARRSCSRMV